MKKVLIVDDDAEFRAMIAEVLREAGYECQEASSGEEALERAREGGFDFVLLDLIMPGVGGMEVLAGLRRLSPRSRVIMTTAFATVDNAVDAIKRGASDYVTKPFKIGELLTVMRRVMEEANFEEGIRSLNLDSALSSLSNPIRRGAIRLIAARERMRLMELTRELDIEDHTKLVFHLRMLREAGIIRQCKDRSYALTPEGRRALECLAFIEERLSG